MRKGNRPFRNGSPLQLKVSTTFLVHTSARSQLFFCVASQQIVTSQDGNAQCFQFFLNGSSSGSGGCSPGDLERTGCQKEQDGTAMNVIEIENLTYSYPASPSPILKKPSVKTSTKKCRPKIRLNSSGFRSPSFTSSFRGYPLSNSIKFKDAQILIEIRILPGRRCKAVSVKSLHSFVTDKAGI